ncbi:hypothetical protein BD289DRAFT_234910 [Coniella lustricola]|uniref:Uncharacterized protein n=1 Tax=Coniella lustricola TaxID=2025994 RepID=A0A2T3A9V5_9PEZI|nr:hypothetical protein BD289DRAFT_234910 [Coniella lustricola]
MELVGDVFVLAGLYLVLAHCWLRQGYRRWIEFSQSQGKPCIRPPFVFLDHWFGLRFGLGQTSGTGHAPPNVTRVIGSSSMNRSSRLVVNDQDMLHMSPQALTLNKSCKSHWAEPTATISRYGTFPGLT